MDTYNHQEELSEAIAAGERAIQSLQEAQAKQSHFTVQPLMA